MVNHADIIIDDPKIKTQNINPPILDQDKNAQNTGDFTGQIVEKQESNKEKKKKSKKSKRHQ